jgi:hypothetical protein
MQNQKAFSQQTCAAEAVPATPKMTVSRPRAATTTHATRVHLFIPIIDPAIYADLLLSALVS